MRRLTTADYARAERLLRHRRDELAFGTRVQPNWLAGSDRFWFLRRDANGARYVVVDPEAGTVTAALDHERLAASLEAASGEAVDAARLPIDHVEVGEQDVSFAFAGRWWTASRDGSGCRERPAPAARATWERPSPDGRMVAFVRDHDLWVRRLADGEERRLTHDGRRDLDYATAADSGSWWSLRRVLGGIELPPAALWSPDSRCLLTHRLDQRDVALAHLVESAPRDGGRPVLHSYRFPVPGDHPLPMAQLLVADVESGELTWAKDEPLIARFIPPELRGDAWWGDAETAYYLARDRWFKRLRLCELDARSGRVRIVVEEHGEPRAELNQYSSTRLPIVRVLASRGEVLWWSQRDGWGHLYRYDLRSGRLLAQVTRGEWMVTEILHVDEEAGVVLAAATGRRASDPYLRTVVRVELDGGELTELVDDDVDHAVVASPSGRFVLDTGSAVDRAPTTVVRDRRGAVTVEVQRADVSRLAAAGWAPPERFQVLAADGVTPLWGVLHRPARLEPGRRYPVVDDLYPGPQINRAYPSFEDQFFPNLDVDALASLGFVVIALDGRGTPGRSRDFHAASYGRLGTAGFLEDHVAALRQLAARYPYIDLGRVGVRGTSGGGFAAVRAMLDHPDVFHVGVAISGAHDERYYQSHWLEAYQGPPEQSDWSEVSNARYADRLRGRLLLAHGEMDENVHPYQTLQLVDALIAAGKDFDLIYVPGVEHGMAGRTGYVLRRSWDFLVRHLLAAEPPSEYALAEPPLHAAAPPFLFC
jgi:dipeptidyl-peptidase-4